MPLLVLLRHAKAEPARADDHARVLAPQGRRDAAAAGRWFVATGISPDLVVVSTAERARQTWAGVGISPAVYDERLYLATEDELLDVVRETQEDVQTLVLVGHNPGLEELVRALDDSPSARDRTNRGLSTCAVALLTVDGWADLGGAVLEELVVPRG